jgi:hypothetical protein
VEAWSCDLLPAEDKSPYHIQDDLLNIITGKWDILIAFPPCTHLAGSGARWFGSKLQEQEDAVNFVAKLLSCGIAHIAVENPVGILSTKLRKPDQIIHPWQFGVPLEKRTCLWLKNLPKLVPTKTLPELYARNGHIIYGRHSAVLAAADSLSQATNRSRTYKGIAAAMAAQWGHLPSLINNYDKITI